MKDITKIAICLAAIALMGALEMLAPDSVAAAVGTFVGVFAAGVAVLLLAGLVRPTPDRGKPQKRRRLSSLLNSEPRQQLEDEGIDSGPEARRAALEVIDGVGKNRPAKA